MLGTSKRKSGATQVTANDAGISTPTPVKTGRVKTTAPTQGLRRLLVDRTAPQRHEGRAREWRIGTPECRAREKAGNMLTSIRSSWIPAPRPRGRRSYPGGSKRRSVDYKYLHRPPARLRRLRAGRAAAAGRRLFVSGLPRRRKRRLPARASSPAAVADSTWKPGSAEPASSGRGPAGSESAQPSRRAVRAVRVEPNDASTARTSACHAASAPVSTTIECSSTCGRRSLALGTPAILCALQCPAFVPFGCSGYQEAPKALLSVPLSSPGLLSPV